MLKNHTLAQAVSDSNFGEIRRQLEYKSSWRGTHLVTIDRFYPSSKTCSACGWKDCDQDLSDRTFICQECGLVILPYFFHFTWLRIVIPSLRSHIGKLLY